MLSQIFKWFKKPRVALQYSGFPRSFDKDFDNHYKYLIKPLNPDIYMHLWKVDKNDEKPEKMVGLYKPKGYTIEVREGHHTDNVAALIKATNIIHPDTDAFAGVSMLYSRYRANQLRIESQKQYDIVISLRTELSFERPIPDTLFTLAKNSIIIPYGYNHAGINDLFCISDPEGADVFNSVYVHLQRLIFDNHVRFNQHTIMLDRLIESGIQIYRPKYPISLRGNKTYDY
jgi:hypothetical protein